MAEVDSELGIPAAVNGDRGSIDIGGFDGGEETDCGLDVARGAESPDRTVRVQPRLDGLAVTRLILKMEESVRLRAPVEVGSLYD